MTLPNSRTAYFNGRWVPEGEVVVPYRDRSFTHGDGVFDMTRSFDGRAFRVKEHIERLYRSLRYLAIDPGLAPAEMMRITEEVLDRNRHLLGPGEELLRVVALFLEDLLHRALLKLAVLADLRRLLVAGALDDGGLRFPLLVDLLLFGRPL